MRFPTHHKLNPDFPRLFKTITICILAAFMVPASTPGSAATVQIHLGSTWTGNGPYGGTVYDLAMAAIPDVLFAATSVGVYKTNDGGFNWFRTSHPTVATYAVAIAPSDGSTLYSGTCDGVYKSENGGDSWQLIVPGDTTSLAVDPRDPGVVYAGSSWDVFKSVDGGDNWGVILDDVRVMDLLLDSNNPDHVYVALEWDLDGLARSTNGGKDWEFIHITTDYWNSEDVYALAMTPAGFNPAAIYAFSVGLEEGVYKSTDGGSTWAPTNTPEWILRNPPVALAVDPGDPNIVYVGAYFFEGHLLRSNNGGESWTPIQNGLPKGMPSAFAIHPSNHSLLLSMEEGGIYSSSNLGDSWQMTSEGLRITTIHHIAIHPQDSLTAIAAVHGSGHYLAKTTDGGASWDYLTSSPTDPFEADDIGAVAYDPGNPNNIYAGNGYNLVDDLWVYKSSDGGLTWNYYRFVVFIDYWGSSGVSDIWVSPDGDSVLVAVEGWGSTEGAGGIYRSTSDMIFWEQEFDHWTNALAADPNAPATVYAGTGRCGYVYRSENGGQTWSNISPPAGDGDCWVFDVRDLTVDANSHVYAATSAGLWKWDGASWTDYPDLPNTDLTGVAIDSGKLYVATAEGGVYLSENGGTSWIEDNDGFDGSLDLAVGGLYLGTSGATVLYAGTHNSGVWAKSSDGGVFRKYLYIPLILSEN